LLSLPSRHGCVASGKRTAWARSSPGDAEVHARRTKEAAERATGGAIDAGGRAARIIEAPEMHDCGTRPLFLRIHLSMIKTSALLLFVATTACAADWRDDVRYFAKELPKRHANAFHHVAKADFDRAVAELEAKAEKASDAEMFVGLSRITAMVGDGHTYVLIPDSARYMPIGVGLYDGHYRVVQTIEPYRAILGTRLVRIGSTPIAEVVHKITPLLPQDEPENYLRATLPTWLMVGDALHGVGIIPQREHAPYTFARDDGTEVTVDVASTRWADKPNWIFATDKPLPSRRRIEEPFWFEAAGPKTLYVMFRRYDDLKSKSRELWRAVDTQGIEKIIVDLRFNSGGDYTKGRAYVIDEMKKRPRLRVVGLIGARTFSAAMVNAVDLRNAGAKLVGTTIGERPNSYQENDEMKLPYSKLVVSYSTRLYKFVPDGAPNVVAPDEEIVPTWSDLMEGRDVVLQRALAQ
jgi:hypothetical protein